MNFELLQQRLVERLRTQVRNGEMTERSLAKRTGISQPHVHNMIKGIRVVTPEMGDQILKCLHWSVLDLLEPEELLGHATRILGDLAPARETPVMAGRLGPGQTWSDVESPFERFAVECYHLANAINPVVARLGEDPHLVPMLEGGDLVLLDRSEDSRRQPLPDELYAIRHGGEALVRGLRRGAERLYLVPPDGQNRPETWASIRVRADELLHSVIARVIPLVHHGSRQSQRGSPTASR